MWHTITKVAESHFLDTAIATKVALDNVDKFSILTVGAQGVSEPEVSTWYADAFVAAVQAAQGDQTGEIRQREFARQYGKEAR